MATPQEVLFAQLSVAHWTCQQMPASSRVRYRILQLLEVALDLATCVDTIPARSMPTFPTAADATAQTQQPQQQPRWEPQWCFPGCAASQGFAAAGFAPAATPTAQPFSGPASSPVNSAGRRLRNRSGTKLRAQCLARSSDKQHKRCKTFRDPSLSNSGQADLPRPSGAPTDGEGPSPGTPPARPAAAPAAAKAAARFAVCEAELLDLSGMSREQVSILAAAVHALDSPHVQVHTAAAQKLQGISADWDNPAAVGEAFLEVGAVQALAALLSSDSSACRVAAAGTLCNVSWYAGPRAAILAAGAVPRLVAMLWDEQQECQEEAACALVALTSTHDEAVCAAVAAAGGIPRLVGLLGSEHSSSAEDDGTADLSANTVLAQTAPPNIGTRADSSDSSSSDSNSSSSSSSWQRVGHNSPASSSASQRSPPAGATPNPPAEPNKATDKPPAADAGSTPVADKVMAAAMRALGHLAAGSATRRAAIASSGQALAHITACLSHDDGACRDAALQALQHITRTEPWRLSDGVVVQQVKAAGALEALRRLLSSSSDNCEVWQALRLRVQLEAPAHPCIAAEPV